MRNPAGHVLRVPRKIFGSSNPNPALYPNLPKFLPEAIATATCVYIPIGEVTDVALVFHIDELNEGSIDPGGMHNAFLPFSIGIRVADCNH